MKITTLIADGELPTRSVLCGLCAERSDLNVVGQVECGAEAFSAIESIRPELLLLDAQLPDMTAVEVLQAVHAPERAFTVLVTNREQPRSNLGDTDSLGYLAKPIERRQFDRLIDTVVARRLAITDRSSGTTASRASAVQRSGAGSAQLIGERAHRFHFLDAHAVDYLEVDGNYVTIHVGDDRFLTRATLKHLSDLLAPHDFVRIDRSLLVNLRQVDFVERLESGKFAFKLRHGQQLMSSRERASGILKLLRSPVR